MTVNIPKEHENYLEYLYGNWKVPDKNWTNEKQYNYQNKKLKRKI